MHDAKHCRNSHTTVMFVTRQNLVDQLFHTRLQVSLWRVYRCSFVFCSWTEVAVAIPRQSTQKQFVVCNFIWIVPITLQHYQWAHHWIVQFSLPSRKRLWHFIFLFLYAPSDVSEEATRAQRCVSHANQCSQEDTLHWNYSNWSFLYSIICIKRHVSFLPLLTPWKNPEQKGDEVFAVASVVFSTIFSSPAYIFRRTSFLQPLPPSLSYTHTHTHCCEIKLNWSLVVAHVYLHLMLDEPTGLSKTLDVC